MAIEYVDSTQLDSDLTSVANAIRAKSGGSSQLAFPAGFVSEIQAIPSGATVYYTANGQAYVKDLVIPEASYSGFFAYRDATHLESIDYSSSAVMSVDGYALGYCTSLKTALLKAKLSNLTANTRLFINDTALETVQFGDIGKPVQNADMSVGTFTRCSQTGLTITIYVTDSATIPFASSPWGATNATIVYKSSTDGSVRTP